MDVSHYGLLTPRLQILYRPCRKLFLPRDAMLARVLAVVVRLSVCHTPVLHRNGQTAAQIELFVMHTGFSRRMLHRIFKENGLSSKSEYFI